VRRYGWVLAVAVAILLVPRVLRVYRVLAVPVLVGAVLVVGWLLLRPILTIPRVSTEGPMVRNGVAAVVACGEKRGPQAVDVAPEPQTGGWWPVRKGECTIWYHRPPDPHQRHLRHQRSSAQEERQTSPGLAREDIVRACGYKVPAEQWDVAGDVATGMRKDCGIYAD
jgi:hypothetical protein